MATKLSRYNGWLPSSSAVYDSFVESLLKKAATPYGTKAAKHVPAVEKFKNAIEANPVMAKLFDNIFLQASQNNKTENFEHFLCLLDVIVVGPPKFHVASEDGREVAEPIGVPMYLVFDILSNTSAAYDLFRMPEFNVALKDLLGSWGDYLKTHDSSKTLTDSFDGWFSEASIKLLEDNRGTFNDTYVVFSTDDVNRGYNSWDEFFTRRVQHTARPLQTVAGVEPKRAIYNACESTVEGWQFDVKAHDRFWLKGMSYSLYDIFDGDEATAQNFVGGTVYQAFLSPQDYHRWHSPIAGTIEEARIVPGTYYAALPDDGVDDDGRDPRGALIRSQPWLTMSSTRAIIVIRSEKFGLVAFIGVGMAEVSSCELLVEKGHTVKPGQEIGLFHFGGSSHALIFERDSQVKLMIEEGVIAKGKHIHVNKIIGVSVHS